MLIPELIVEKNQPTGLLNVETDEQGWKLKQCLWIIFAGFVVVRERMLEDHLSPEKYLKCNKDFRKESIAVPRINANPERILDTLMELKSEGLDIIYVGMIVFSRNNTSKWPNSLSKGDMAKWITFARDSKTKQKQHYF